MRKKRTLITPALREECLRLRLVENRRTNVIAERTKLSRWSVYKLLKGYPCRRKPRIGHGVEWTADRVDTLRRLWPTAEPEQLLAALPGCSLGSIGRKASALKIKRLPPSSRKNLRSVHPLIMRLREARVDRGWARKVLAHKAGYHKSQIAEWELGTSSIKLTQLEDLANALGFELILQTLKRIETLDA